MVEPLWTQEAGMHVDASSSVTGSWIIGDSSFDTGSSGVIIVLSDRSGDFTVSDRLRGNKNIIVIVIMIITPKKINAKTLFELIFIF
jgi:hypothetical protein